jgi:hypothetical protein
MFGKLFVSLWGNKNRTMILTICTAIAFGLAVLYTLTALAHVAMKIAEGVVQEQDIAIPAHIPAVPAFFAALAWLLHHL